MGSCVSALSGVAGGDRSRKERTFQVWNLDEQGLELSPGKMEVNATDLVLHQRGRPPVRWPLRGLRRYGFDAQLFSFESGRRCPTGSGIYAFRCHRAEGLFNALQECIQNSGAASAMTTTISSAGTQQDQHPQQPPSNLPTQRELSFPLPASSGPTVDSSGYLEPIALGPLPRSASQPPLPPTSLNIQQQQTHSYVNACAQCGLPHPPPCVDINTNYAKLDDLLRQEAGGKQRDHFYVNVNPSQQATGHPLQNMGHLQQGMGHSQQTTSHPQQTTGHSQQTTSHPQQTTVLSQQTTPHSYANLSCPASPDRALSADEVNYVVLDLDHQSDSITGAVSPVTTTPPSLMPPTSQPTSPLRTPEGYATIDFDRTAALSNSANPGAHHHDDSVRKTRHNSTAVPVLC